MPKHKRGKHPNSKANLNPMANSKGGRTGKRVFLSDNAIKGAEILAKRLGYMRADKPNVSEATNYVLEAVHWIMEYGGQFTMTDDGLLHLKSEKDEPTE